MLYTSLSQPTSDIVSAVQEVANDRFLRITQYDYRDNGEKSAPIFADVSQTSRRINQRTFDTDVDYLNHRQGVRGHTGIIGAIDARLL